MPSLFATLAPLPGEVAASVVSQLPPDAAAAMSSLASATSPVALPPPPDPATLAHVLARMSGPSRRAVLNALPADQQAAVNAALLDTALLYMTYRVHPACP
jgi:hypothetical protein